jgi:multidrug efflux system membrane fusion protein
MSLTEAKTPSRGAAADATLVGAPAVAEPSRPKHVWRWIAALAVVAIVIYLVARPSSRPSAASEGKAAGKNAPRAIPVTGSAATTGDLGVYLNGLGTVTALNTVTVRSRVDGQLVRVAFQEGQYVHQGDLLAEIDPRPFQVQLTQALGQQAKDEATLKNAQIDLERYRVLAEQDSIPRQQLDTQAATVSQLEASLKSDQGQVESAKLNLVYSKITAPISGIVGLRLVDVGNIVHATDANGLVVITQIQPITVVFTIPADQLPSVLRQMKAGKHLAVDAYDRDLKNKLATGSVLAIDNQIDATTGTVKIKAVFANDSRTLFANQFVNARLLVDTLRQTVLVPSAAIQRSPQSTYVYVVKPDSTVDLRNVDVQLTEGDVAAIRQGVAAGDVVVTDGVDKLQPGSKVALSMAAGGAPRKAAS